MTLDFEVLGGCGLLWFGRGRRLWRTIFSTDGKERDDEHKRLLKNY